jgi:hypothetical protein
MAKNKGGGGLALVVIGVSLAAANHVSDHGGAQTLTAAASSVGHTVSSAVQAVTGGGGPGTRRGWAKAFLAAIPEPVTRCNVNAVVAWETAEGGGFGNQAANDPLNLNPPANTSWPGQHVIGAWAFPTATDGLTYTVQVIHNGSYGSILAALSQGGDAQAVCNAIMASPWAGSHYSGSLTASC